jgi:ribosomal protein S18 acetylase RimI-like enzyme
VSEPHLRPYRPSDLDALYEICLRTGLAGGDAGAAIDDPRLLGDIYVAPYAALEPELAFVVDDGTGTPGGYIVGALDTRRFEAACEEQWWPELRRRHPRDRRTGRFDDLLVAMIHDPIAADDAVVAEHPSHLHIDLLPALQGRGWGRRLMDRLTMALAAAGSRGVHLGVNVANERAIAFYRHLGFEELTADPVTITFGRRLT